MFAQDVYKQIQKEEMDAASVIDQASIEKESAVMDEDATLLGRKLFEIAAACRIKGIEPESALRRYAQNVVDTLEAESNSVDA